MRRRVIATAALLFLVAGAGSATGAGSLAKLGWGGCLSNRAQDGCTRLPHHPLDELWGIVVSPDGKQVYGADDYTGTLTEYARADDGSLTYTGCFANLGDHGCEAPTHASLGGLAAMAMSPAGDSIYVVSDDSSAVTSFQRASDGTLTFQGCIADRGKAGCQAPDRNVLRFPAAIAVSPDGLSVYVATEDHVLAEFDRAPDGSLTYVGCFADRGRHDCEAPKQNSISFATSLAVSPDGKNVYVGSFDDWISIFSRSPDGSLTSDGCITDQRPPPKCGQYIHPATLVFNESVVVTPDGKSLLVSADKTFASFDRSSDGSLKLSQCFTARGNRSREPGCEQAGDVSFGYTGGIAVSSDGGAVYLPTGGRTTASLVAFTRSPSGHLTLARCIVEPVAAAPCHLTKHTEWEDTRLLALSPDGTSLYAGGYQSITWFGHHGEPQPPPGGGGSPCPKSDAHLPYRHDGPARRDLVPGHPSGLVVCRYRGVNVRHGEKPLGLIRGQKVSSPRDVHALARRFASLPQATTDSTACPADTGAKVVARFKYPDEPDDFVSTEFSGCEAVTNGPSSRRGSGIKGRHLRNALVNLLVPPTRVRQRTMSPNSISYWDPDHGVMGTGNRYRVHAGTIKTTDDGGRTFHIVLRTHSGVTWVDTAGTRDVWAFIQDRHHSHLLHSADGGTTWERPPDPPGHDPSFATPDFGVMPKGGDSDRVYSTTDGGRSWAKLKTPCRGSEALAVSAATEDELLEACGGYEGVGGQPKAIFASHDGGGHWEILAQVGWATGDPWEGQAPNGGLDPVGYISDLIAGPPGVGILFNDYAMLTLDGGENWDDIEAPGGGYPLSGQFFTPDSGVLLDSVHLLQTADGGQSWTLLHRFP